MSRIDGRRGYSFVGMRVIIPPSLRERVLDDLHAGHPFQNFLQFYALVIKSLYFRIHSTFSINRPSMQLIEREGPNNSTLMTLSTKT